MPHDPTDGELAEYIVRTLDKTGLHPSDPDLIAELMAVYRDLWVMLYRVDQDDLDDLDALGDAPLGDPS